MELDELKLIYVQDVGETHKKENIYEFIFAENSEDVDYEEWGWNADPAIGYARAPEPEYVKHCIEVKTSKFKLICLHNSDLVSYMHGYYTIQAIAYEPLDYESEDESDGVLVFHYNTSLRDVVSMLNGRGVFENDNGLYMDGNKIKFTSKKQKKENISTDEGKDIDEFGKIFNLDDLNIQED